MKRLMFAIVAAAMMSVCFAGAGLWTTANDQLKLWVVQLRGGPRPWDKEKDVAANKFFNAKIDNSSVDAYTGRVQ